MAGHVVSFSPFCSSKDNFTFLDFHSIYFCYHCVIGEHNLQWNLSLRPLRKQSLCMLLYLQGQFLLCPSYRWLSSVYLVPVVLL